MSIVQKQLADKVVNVSEEDLVRFEPSPDFNEAHNRSVIEKTIKDTEANYLRRKKHWEDELGERTEAVGAYIRHLVHKNDSTPVEQYLGKQYLAQLRGEQKLAKIRRMAQEKGYI